MLEQTSFPFVDRPVKPGKQHICFQHTMMGLVLGQIFALQKEEIRRKTASLKHIRESSIRSQSLRVVCGLMLCPPRLLEAACHSRHWGRSTLSAQSRPRLSEHGGGMGYNPQCFYLEILLHVKFYCTSSFSFLLGKKHNNTFLGQEED